MWRMIWIAMWVALALAACADEGYESADEVVVSWDGEAVVVSLELDAPRVGKNAVAVRVEREDEGAPVEDLVVRMVPDMPSMGHGSPGNVDPSHVGAGRYEGVVNFTMPGEWRLVFLFSRGEVLGEVAFEVWL